jgi:hypothetical protein
VKYSKGNPYNEHDTRGVEDEDESPGREEFVDRRDTRGDRRRSSRPHDDYYPPPTHQHHAQYPQRPYPPAPLPSSHQQVYTNHFYPGDALPPPPGSGIQPLYNSMPIAMQHQPPLMSQPIMNHHSTSNMFNNSNSNNNMQGRNVKKIKSKIIQAKSHSMQMRIICALSKIIRIAKILISEIYSNILSKVKSLTQKAV